MKSLISPVQRRPPVLPGPTPRGDDATSTAPVSGRTAATTESRVVREARNYADPDILAPRWLRVSDTPFDAPYKATKGYGRQMHPTTVSYDAPDGFQISPDRGTHYEEAGGSPSRCPPLSPDRGGVSLTAPSFPAYTTSAVKRDAVPQGRCTARVPRAAQDKARPGFRWRRRRAPVRRRGRGKPRHAVPDVPRAFRDFQQRARFSLARPLRREAPSNGSVRPSRIGGAPAASAFKRRPRAPRRARQPGSI